VAGVGAGTGAAGGGEALRQQVRQLELAAVRRQQEGEDLVRAAEAALAGILTPAYQEQVRRGVRHEVERLVDQEWTMVDARPDYYALLNDAGVLRELAEGIFDAAEVALLSGGAAPAKNLVDLSDLPAIHYLFVISQGPEEVGRTIHDYVVVDEAQDVAELDLHCLRLLERRRCFTLLGDLSQSIYGHRGLTSWQQAEAIFTGPGGVEESPYQYEECGVSYRTTAEITRLANRVLRSMAALATLRPVSGVGGEPRPVVQADEGLDGRGGFHYEARAFDRHGPEPVVMDVADEAALVQAVGEAVAQARERRYASVAVIAKTAARARELAERLGAAGVEGVTLIDRPEEMEFRGGAVVLPVHLAKGLEFDAAVVADVDGTTYGGNAFDARLLYVALTRAMHDLRVLWTGGQEAMTPHLVG
jgi:DNA helicase-2/ATP-dependent DNA helicase PcrA